MVTKTEHLLNQACGKPNMCVNLRCIIAGCLCGWLVVWPSYSFAQLYRWTDANGRVHFSDSKQDLSKTLRADVKVVSQARVTDYRSREPIDFTALNARGPVRLYTSSDCEPCDQARAFLTRHRVIFEEYDVANSIKGVRAFETLDLNEIPVVIFSGKQMVGWDPDLFDLQSVMTETP